MSDVIKFDSGRCAQLVSQLIRVRGSLENANYSIGQVSRNPLYNIHNCNLYRDIEAVNNCIAALQQIIGLMESTESNLARYEIPHQNVGVNVNVDVRGGTGSDSDANSHERDPFEFTKTTANPNAAATPNNAPSDVVPDIPHGPTPTPTSTPTPQDNSTSEDEYSWMDNYLYWLSAPFHRENWQTDGGVSGPSLSGDENGVDNNFFSIFGIEGDAEFHDNLGNADFTLVDLNSGGWGVNVSGGASLFARDIEAQGGAGYGVGYNQNGYGEGGNISASGEASISGARLYETRIFTTPFFTFTNSMQLDAIEAGVEVNGSATSTNGYNAGISAEANVVDYQNQVVITVGDTNYYGAISVDYGSEWSWELPSESNGNRLSLGPFSLAFGVSTGEPDIIGQNDSTVVYVPDSGTTQSATYMPDSARFAQERGEAYAAQVQAQTQSTTTYMPDSARFAQERGEAQWQ